MKCVVIFYHKNIESIYDESWILKCVNSIKDQTHKDFDVIELNYGGGEKKYCEGIKSRYFFLNTKFSNHIGAMNYLYDLSFHYGYDVVFNTNMDDYYSPVRLEKQIKAIKRGFQLISSNFQYIGGDKNGKLFNFNKNNIGDSLSKGHNIIAHPVIAMHKTFWDSDLKYNNFLGKEDLDLWQRAFSKGKKFCILEECLLFYRIHKNQVTKKYKV